MICTFEVKIIGCRYANEGVYTTVLRQDLEERYGKNYVSVQLIRSVPEEADEEKQTNDPINS